MTALALGPAPAHLAPALTAHGIERRVGPTHQVEGVRNDPRAGSSARIARR